jgi:hypothetical protein
MRLVQPGLKLYLSRAFMHLLFLACILAATPFSLFSTLSSRTSTSGEFMHVEACYSAEFAPLRTNGSVRPSLLLKARSSKRGKGVRIDPIIV